MPSPPSAGGGQLVPGRVEKETLHRAGGSSPARAGARRRGYFSAARHFSAGAGLLRRRGHFRSASTSPRGGHFRAGGASPRRGGTSAARVLLPRRGRRPRPGCGARPSVRDFGLTDWAKRDFADGAAALGAPPGGGFVRPRCYRFRMNTESVAAMGNDELVEATRELVRRSCAVEAELLLHLGEIDQRRLYLVGRFPRCLRSARASSGFRRERRTTASRSRGPRAGCRR